MRFSIRDLLWLMAVVGLAATVFTDRENMRRQRFKLAEEKMSIEADASAAVAAAQKQLVPLRHDNAILRHQAVLHLEEQAKLERKLEWAAQRPDRTPEPSGIRAIAVPAPVLSESIESQR